MEEKKKPTEGAAGRLPHKGSDIISQLAQQALAAGYRVVPVLDRKPLGTFKNGETYPLTDSRWSKADAVAVCMDRAVLLDYDGNKSDDIISLGELSKLLDLDIMPAPVQTGAEGKSLHYLFRLPADAKPGENINQSTDGTFKPHIDIKTGNQLMFLKPGKTLGELKPVDQLPLAPAAMIEALRNVKRVPQSYDGAVRCLLQGEPIHESARTVVNRLTAQGKSKDEIWAFFGSLKPAMLLVRDAERIEELFGEELNSLINTAQPPMPVPFVEEDDSTVWDDWVYAGHEDIFYNKKTDVQLTAAAFNRYMSTEPRSAMVNGKPKKIPAAEYALEHVGIPIVDYLMYAPLFGALFTHRHASYVNTFDPASIPEAASSFPPDFQAHIEMLFPDDYEVIIQWMAWVALNPGQKVQWALLLKGIEGDGKGTITNMMRAAMGMRNVREVSQIELDEKFTAWAEGHCLNVLNEVRIKGQSKYSVMEKLKALITDQYISVVKKTKDGKLILNMTNYLITTNHEDALAVGIGDRRYGVFFTQFKDRAELPSVESYYTPLNALIESNPGAVRAWLESVDLTGFNPKSAPAVTEAKAAMIAKAESTHVSLLRMALEVDALGVDAECFIPKNVNDVIQEELGGGDRPLSYKMIAAAASTLGFEKKGRMSISGFKQVSVWAKPHLTDEEIIKRLSSTIY